MVEEYMVFKYIGREITVSIVCTNKQIGEETRTNRVVGIELVGCRKRYNCCLYYNYGYRLSTC